MGRIAIVGGHGQIALQLIPLLADRGHEPIALVRNPDYFGELEALGAEPRLLDIEKAGPLEFPAAFEGADVIVFAAGAGPDGLVERKQTVDLWGALASIQTAKTKGISRFVQISAIGIDREPDPDRGEVWAAYVRAKRDADIALRDSGLDWTIIRPGRLTNEPATHKVSLGLTIPRVDVPRADVAAVLAHVIDDDRTIGRQWNLVRGSSSIPDAIDRAIAP